MPWCGKSAGHWFVSFCETQSHIEHWLSSSIFTCSFVRSSVRPSAWWHLHLSPLYDVLDHTNHIFSESSSSGDLLGVNIFVGEYFFRGWIFFRVNNFQGWIFFRGEYFPRVNIFQRWMFLWAEYFQGEYFSGGEYFPGMNIFQVNILQGWIFLGFDTFQGRIFFKSEYFSRVNIFQGWIFSAVNHSKGWIFSWVNIFQGWIFFSGEHLSFAQWNIV